MFKRYPVNIKEIVMKNLRKQGLETPLLQRRLIESWPEVAGETVARYTQGLYIRNQTLHVHLTSPALRAELSMRREELTRRLNEHVNAQVIANILFN